MRKFYLIQTNDNIDFGNQNLANEFQINEFFDKEENSILEEGNIIRIIRIMTQGVCFEIETSVIVQMIESAVIDYKFGSMSDSELNLMHIALVEYSHKLNLDYQELRCPDLAKIIFDLSKQHDEINFYNKMKIINKRDEEINYKNCMLNNFECKY